jgi:hypothetical protein
MASYNAEQLVFKVRIKYLDIMLGSKFNFIYGLYNGITPTEYKETNDNDWDVNHDFIKQIDKDIGENDELTTELKKKMPNTFKRVPIHKFEATESRFARLLNNAYSRNYKTIQGVPNKTDYLTQMLENMGKDGRIFDKRYYVPYYHKGETKPYAYHDYADYLSMLYNVDLRVASWNNTIKDCAILGKDLVVLQTHPNACPSCNYHAGKVYSVSGKTKGYPKLEDAVNDGVAHPNCKCQITIYYDDTQLENQDLVKTDYYEDLQKARGYQRKIRELRNEQSCYEVINNRDKAEEIQIKREKLQDNYRLFKAEHPEIEIYL